MKEYIYQANYKIIVNKVQRIEIEAIHIKWMNEKNERIYFLNWL
jgi:hypothetical protein